MAEEIKAYDNFLVSEALADRIDMSDFSDTKNEYSDLTVKNAEVVINFFDSEEILLCDLLGWNSHTVTLQVPAAHLVRFWRLGFSRGQPRRPTITVFDDELDIGDCTLEKKDGIWHATVYLGYDI